MLARASAEVRPHARLRSSSRSARATRVTRLPAIQPSKAPSITSASMARMPGRTVARVARMLPMAVRTRSLQRSVMDVSSSYYAVRRAGARSLLHRARDEAPDQEALQSDDDQHGWKAGQHRRCRDVAPRYLEDSREERQRDRDRAARLRDRERVGEQEFVPAEEKGQERRGRKAGRQQRDHDPAKEARQPCPVHRRRLLRLDRNLADEPGEKPDGQRQGERGVYEDEPRPRIAQIERAHQQVERAHGRDLGKRRAGHDRQEQEPLARQRKPGHRVRAGYAERERQQRGERGDAEAVGERLRHQALLDDGAIVRERQLAWQERRHPEQLGLGLERRQELPEKRDRVADERREHEGVGDPTGSAPHAVTVLVLRRRRYAQATAMTSANTTTPSAEPKPSWSVWKRAR